MKGESFRGDGPIRRISSGPEAPEHVARALADRIEMLTALAAAVDRRTELMQIVENSDDEEQAEQTIRSWLNVSGTAAHQVLQLQLRQFVTIRRNKIDAELAACTEQLRQLRGNDQSER